MRQMDGKEDFLTGKEKSSAKIPQLKFEEYELEFLKRFKIRRGDLVNSLHLTIPDD